MCDYLLSMYNDDDDVYEVHCCQCYFHVIVVSQLIDVFSVRRYYLSVNVFKSGKFTDVGHQ